MKGTHHLGLAAVALMAWQSGVAAAIPACEAALVPESIPWANEQLDRADEYLAAGNLDKANEALYHFREFPRSADVSVSVRCLGDDVSRRWFETGQRAALGNARAAQSEGQVATAIIEYGKGGSLDEVRTLAGGLAEDSVAFKGLVGQFTAMGTWTPSLGVGGDLPPLPEQARLMESYLALAREFAARLEKGASRRLAEESTLMSAPISAQERSLMNAQGAGDALFAAVTNTQAEAAKRIPVEVVRVQESQRLLADARDMLDAARADPGSALARAVERGDQMRVVAADESVVPYARASIHQSAIRYYRIGRAEDKKQRAEAEQPRYDQLAEDAAARRKALAEAAAVDLEKQAAEAREAAAAMEKTEAEKQAFQDEADALEKELGF